MSQQEFRQHKSP